MAELTRRAWLAGSALACALAGCRRTASPPQPRWSGVPVEPDVMLRPGTMAEVLAAIRHDPRMRPVHELYVDPDWVWVRTDRRHYQWTRGQGFTDENPHHPLPESRPLDLDALPLVDLADFRDRAVPAMARPDPQARPTVTIYNRETYGRPAAFVLLDIEMIPFDEHMRPRADLDVMTASGLRAAWGEMVTLARLRVAHRLELTRDQLLVLAPNEASVTGVDDAATMSLVRAGRWVRSAVAAAPTDLATWPVAQVDPDVLLAVWARVPGVDRVIVEARGGAPVLRVWGAAGELLFDAQGRPIG